MSTAAALAVAFLAGFVALSFELLWYRAYSIALMARPQAFGVLLGGYLAGIGVGAWLSGRLCVRLGSRSPRPQLGWILIAAAALGYVLVPGFAWLVTVSRSWGIATVLVAACSCGLGLVFPLVVHASVPAEGRVGRVTSRLYFANIIGSSSGSVVTGFWLMDRFGLAAITSALSGALMAAGLVVLVAFDCRRWRVPVTCVALLVAGAVASHGPAFAHLYERLFFRVGYDPAVHFSEIVENRSGVIGVTADGAVYGAGVHDGFYNTDLRLARLNTIQEAYAIGLFHPAPARVLMIGLSSGSWAVVAANHPQVTDLTVVEINPGYVTLLRDHPAVAGLLSDARVHIVIDDGRHWMRQHDDRFDLIVANTTYHWRANASSLLSVEFLELVRQHLRPGGVYYFNTTSEPRVQRTAATAFPFAWRLYNMMAVSDGPIQPDLTTFRRQLGEYRLYGAPSLDLSRASDRDLQELLVTDAAGDLEPRDRILSRTNGAELITDDNMGTEWRLSRYQRRQ
ncbi:MAG: fused MFS/spermidine synthase [Vicinamibacterales bacterium]